MNERYCRSAFHRYIHQELIVDGNNFFWFQRDGESGFLLSQACQSMNSEYENGLGGKDCQTQHTVSCFPGLVVFTRVLALAPCRPHLSPAIAVLIMVVKICCSYYARKGTPFS